MSDKRGIMQTNAMIVLYMVTSSKILLEFRAFDVPYIYIDDLKLSRVDARRRY